jgi:4-amino-4-deoxy-L-arabinose transferase-like glycosyltransferase
LVAAGIVLRLLAVIGWWPASTTLDDGYQLFAEDPFANPLHPAGYSLVLGAIGNVSREIAVPVLLQHLAGVASALLLFAATRRLTGSQWAGLLPAAAVLLNPDQIFLEHAIMSESWIVLFTAIGLYAAARAFDAPDPAWRWPALAGVALALAVTIRAAGLLLIAIAALVLLLCGPRGTWRDRWRTPVTLLGAAGVVLLGFAAANSAWGGGFELAPSSGWYHYGRAAQFADCDRFTPPPGTDALCETLPPDARPGGAYYMFNPQSPAQRLFGDPSQIYGGFGQDDDKLGAWARRAVLAQPLDYLSTLWEYGRAYWLPGLEPEPETKGSGLDPQLDFTRGLEPTLGAALFKQAVEDSLEQYFDPFAAHAHRAPLDLLRALQHVTRFGAVLLSITTMLTLVGLIVGSRRSRSAVSLFGLGGLSLLVAPILTANYYGRYTVPLAGLMTAAAAIAIVELWRRRGPPVPSNATSANAER